MILKFFAVLEDKLAIYKLFSLDSFTSKFSDILSFIKTEKIYRITVY